uniref:Heme attachment to plastid cytochrome c n=1 Tax=Cephaleuros parasiticus TaxID=173370 RepID=UPI001EE0CA0E|nr:Heme attachment to plastid cytochrome c [Cephaleuros parasiticus]UIB38982.1 Heme attachment to plastid cytochrome c [Cephaleuros parasiticus]
MHVSIMIFSYTIFIVGGLISLILLVRALPFKRATWQRLRASPKMIVSKTFSRPRGAFARPSSFPKGGASGNQSNNFYNIAVPTANSFLVSQPELEKINYLNCLVELTRLSKLFDSKFFFLEKAQHSQINQWKFVKTESQMNFDSFSIALDQISYRLFGIGFPLFTLGILSGAVWANSAWGSYWSWDLKETASFVNWLIIAFYLHCRYKNMTKLSYLVGFLSLVFLFFNFFGISLGIFGSSLHAYGASS